MLRRLAPFVALGVAAALLSACAHPTSSPLLPAAPGSAPAAVSGDLDAASLAVNGQLPVRPICATARAGYARCFAWVRTDIASDFSTDSVPPNAGYTAADIQHAYSLDATKGSGQVIATVDAFGYTQAESDLAVYRQANGLPACTTANGCFRIVNQKGKAGPLPKPNSNPGDDWRPEQALDLDSISATCPKCHIILVQANSDSFSNLVTAVRAAGNVKANVISNSYGGQGTVPPPYLTAYNQPGRVIVASAGDSGGGSQGTSQFPCSGAYVVCAGGTELIKSSGGRGYVEHVWNDFAFTCGGGNRCGATGSGCNAQFAKPTWQTDGGAGKCNSRSESDISASASPIHGFAVYISIYGGWGGYGGTSESSPLIAGMFGLAGNASGRHGAMEIWQHHSSFNDVTIGSNVTAKWSGPCASAVKYVCAARPGYDGPTGWGSPKGVSDL